MLVKVAMIPSAGILVLASESIDQPVVVRSSDILQSINTSATKNPLSFSLVKTASLLMSTSPIEVRQNLACQHFRLLEGLRLTPKHDD
jgi:hypothetical protein